MLIRKFLLMATFLLGCSVTWADDAQALEQVRKARAQYDVDSMSAQEQSLKLLFDAYLTSRSSSIGKEILEEYRGVYRNYTSYINSHIPPFMDEYKPENLFMYQNLEIWFKDARGKRMVGLATMSSGNLKGGVEKIREAALEGDALSAYMMAEASVIGNDLWGIKKDADIAYKWLLLSAEYNYAPAVEKLAAVHWDADANWNAVHDQHRAAALLDKAMALYSQYNLKDSRLRSELQTYIESLRRIRAEMQSFIGYDTGKVIAGFYPSYLALRLSTYSENEAGLRARAYYIKSRLIKYGGTYHLAGLPNIDLSKIPIRLSVSEPQWLGQAKRSFTSSDSINLQIDVHVENFSDITDETSRWRREIAINGTIAHEMAHCFLFCKYYHIFNSDYIYRKQLVEGHANNAEYAFVNAVYFYQGMSAERFAREHCSVDYGNYFRWYRNHCLLPNGNTDWTVIERHERVASPTGEGGKVRTLVPGPDGTFKAPFFFR